MRLDAALRPRARANAANAPQSKDGPSAAFTALEAAPTIRTIATDKNEYHYRFEGTFTSASRRPLGIVTPHGGAAMQIRPHMMA